MGRKGFAEGRVLRISGGHQCSFSRNEDSTRSGVPSGGARRIRTADQGFADPCLTAWLWRQRGVPLVKGIRQFSTMTGGPGV
jgi:hypothetical protein